MKKGTISTDLRRTLMKAMEDSRFQVNFTASMRQARVQVKTHRDAELLLDFEEALWNAKDSASISETLLQERRQPRSRSFVRHLKTESLRNGKPVPPEISQRIDQLIAEEDAALKAAEAEQKMDEERASREHELASKLYGNLSEAIGLPRQQAPDSPGGVIRPGVQ